MNLKILDTVAITKGELHIVAIGNKTYIHFQCEQGHGVFGETNSVTAQRVHDALVEAVRGNPVSMAYQLRSER